MADIAIPTLLLNAMSRNPAKLQDPNLLTTLAEQCAKDIGMRQDGPSDTRVYPKNGHVGIMVFTPILESHIILTTYPEFRLINITVESCKPFDFMQVIGFWTEHLELEHHMVAILNRAQPWYWSPEKTVRDALEYEL